MCSGPMKMLKNILKSCGGCGTCGRPKPNEVFEPKPKSEAAPATSFDHHDHGQKPRLHHSPSSSWGGGDGDSTIDNDLTSFNNVNNNVDTSSTTNSCSEHSQFDPSPSSSSAKMVAGRRAFPKFGDGTVAIVKDSDDPYDDFRRSMLQMILEREIYTRDDLQELLNCFLQLNSSSHHKVIVQAFADIWNDAVVSKKPNCQHHDFH